MAYTIADKLGDAQRYVDDLRRAQFMLQLHLDAGGLSNAVVDAHNQEIAKLSGQVTQLVAKYGGIGVT